VLTGYQATGRFDPGHWRIVRSDGRDVGCLLLADHPAADQWELVYMGLVPAARGHGLGAEMIRFSQYLTGQAGRGRLVLAVDADNAPALALYASAGFLRWDRRSAFLRIFGNERQG
jgi:RimJ/RimL family protein N-acetyltransferase